MKKWMILLVFLLSACDSAKLKEEDYPLDIFVKQIEAVDTTIDYDTKGWIVPLYLYPSEERTKEFDRIVTMKYIYPDLPIIVIINPHNGPGEYSEDYDNLIKKYEILGISTIGYIYADYANRPLEDIHADIDQFKELYPELDGFFIDEVDEEGNEDYYQSIYDYAGELNFLVGNPGTEVTRSYYDIFNIIIVSETKYERVDKEELNTDTLKAIAPFQKGVIIHNVPDELEAIWFADYVNWIYVTEFDTYSKLTNQFEAFTELLVEENS